MGANGRGTYYIFLLEPTGIADFCTLPWLYYLHYEVILLFYFSTDEPYLENLHRKPEQTENPRASAVSITQSLHFFFSFSVNVCVILQKKKVRVGALAWCQTDSHVSLSSSRVPDCFLSNDSLPRPRAQQPPQRDRLHTRRKCSLLFMINLIQLCTWPVSDVRWPPTRSSAFGWSQLLGALKGLVFVV